MDFYYIDIRYKLQVKVADHTGSTSFLLFDREVIQFIHRSAYELLEQQVQVCFPLILHIFHVSMMQGLNIKYNLRHVLLLLFFILTVRERFLKN